MYYNHRIALGGINAFQALKVILLFLMTLSGVHLSVTLYGGEATVSPRHPMDLHRLEGVRPEHVEKIMSMTEAQILAAMPEQTPRIHTGCPKCHAHKKELTWMDHGERGQLRHLWYWHYDPLEPNKITCMLCDEAYPDNPQYPESHEERYTNPAGDTYTVRSYLEKGDPDSVHKAKRRDKYYYMRGSLDTARWYWMRDQMRNLARLYHKTKEEKYAEKALIIFNAYCDRFPHFLMCTSYGRHYKNVTPGKRLDRRVVTRAGRRGGEDGDHEHMWPTFDLLYNSKAMQRSAERFGEDLREKYIRNVVAYCTESGKPYTQAELAARREKKMNAPLKGGQQGAPSPGRWDLVNQDTEALRRVIRSWEQFPFNTFTVDGGYLEGLGYGSIQLISTVKFRRMNGYSDPLDYQVPEGQKRYQNFQYPTGEYEKFYARALEVHEALRLPSGSKVRFQDSSSSTSASFIKRDPLERAVSINRPGIEHIILGDGEGEDMIQAHIGFGNGTWHSHRDTLGLQLWAHGHYLLDDINYPKHRLRAEYSTNTYHNTVTVDGRDHATNMGDGDVSLYEPNLPGFSVVKVDAPRAYMGDPDIYARQLMLVTTDPKRPYVIDVFRIRGGKVKDYMLLSSTKHQTRASYDLPLKPMSGEAPLSSFHKRYRAFTNMSQGDGARNFAVTYELSDPDPYPPLPVGEKPQSVGTKHHFIGGKDITVYKTQIPSNKALFKGGYEKFSEYPQQWPFTIVRHEGGDEESLFVAIHEPYKGTPAIQSVKRLDTEDDRQDVLALEIQFADRRDRLVMSLSNEPVQANVGGMSLNGRLGFVAQKSSQGKGEFDAYLIGGTSFKDRMSGAALTRKSGEFSGRIRKSARIWDGDAYNGFLLEGDNLPEVGTALRGQWIRLENRGRIDVVPDRTQCFRAPYKGGTSRESALRNAKNDMEKRRAEFFFNESGIETTVQIDRVIQKDGAIWLITRRDHGIRIDDQAGLAEEVFIPARQVRGRETTFQIVNSIATQGRPVVSPAGGAFLSPVQVALSTPAVSGQLEYAFHLQPSDMALQSRASQAAPAGLKWQTYHGELTLSQNGRLFVRSRGGKAIKTPLPDVYDFRFAVPPVALEADSVEAKLVPGLMAEFLILHSAGPITPESEKPDFDLPGRNDYQYFDSLYAKFNQPEYYDGEYLAAVKRQPSGQIEDLITQYYADGNYFGRKRFSGYIKVPKDGVYTFYFRRNHDGYLAIDGKRLLDYHGHIGEPIAQSVDYPLSKGLHKIEFCVQLKPSVVKDWSKDFELSWEGPGFTRRDMTESDYVCDESLLSQRRKQVRPLQLRHTRPTVKYEGQPLFVTKEEAARLYQERDLGGPRH